MPDRRMLSDFEDLVFCQHDEAGLETDGSLGFYFFFGLSELPKRSWYEVTCSRLECSGGWVDDCGAILANFQYR